MDNQAQELAKAEKLYAAPLSLPCSQDWHKMSGDDRIRFCSMCQKNVYNVSQMSRKDAVALISEKEGNLCVRYYQRPDGTVITTECFTFIGKGGVRPKHPVMKFLAWLNFIIAASIVTCAPILGPAVVTIIQGGLSYGEGPRNNGEAPIVD